VNSNPGAEHLSWVGLTIVGGLPHGPMRFEEYDPAYPSVFAEVVTRIRDALPDVRAEHTGSTSVPGLGGLPAPDMVVVADAGNPGGGSLQPAHVGAHRFSMGLR